MKNLHPKLQNLDCITFDAIGEIKHEIENLNKDFIKSFVVDSQNHFSSSSCKSPQEIHPYLNRYENVMPKEPKMLIIGTFPPASYLISEFKKNLPELKAIKANDNVLISSPQLDFYHGNKNSLWEIMDINPEITIENIIQFLKHNKIAYCDIVYSCSRKRITDTRDADLINVVPNFNLINYLLGSKSITHLWFTSSCTFNKKGIEIDKNGLVKVSGGQAYNLFLRSLQFLYDKIEVSLDGDKYCQISKDNKQKLMSSFKHIICHHLRINERIFTVYTGPSPSQGANISLSRHPKYNEWRAKHTNNFIHKPSTIAYRKYIYKQFIDRIIVKN